MTLSTRLTRAAVAFLIFGTVASVLPMNTSALAAPGYPGVSNGNGRGRRNRGVIIAAIVVIGGIAYYASSHGGKLFPYAAGKKKTRQEQEKDRRNQEFERLDRFTRPSDAPANLTLDR